MSRLPAANQLPREQLHTALANHRPALKWWARYTRRAAVTAVLARRSQAVGPALLFMQRTRREGDPWSGHMSFPGGRQDPSDSSIRTTAIREMAEETGLDLTTHAAPLGRLSDIASRPFSLRRLPRRPLVISSFVYWLEAEPVWQPDPTEVEKLVWVPFDFLADPANRGEMSWGSGRLTLTLPCIDYEDHRIWGLTLRMVDELIEITTTD